MGIFSSLCSSQTTVWARNVLTALQLRYTVEPVLRQNPRLIQDSTEPLCLLRICDYRHILLAQVLLLPVARRFYNNLHVKPAFVYVSSRFLITL